MNNLNYLRNNNFQNFQNVSQGNINNNPIPYPNAQLSQNFSQKNNNSNNNNNNKYYNGGKNNNGSGNFSKNKQ